MTKTFNRTLFVESSSYGSGNDIVEYFEKKYPEFELVDIAWSVDTNDLQALVSDLEFTENVIEVLHECQDEEHGVCCFCCNKTKNLEFYQEKRRKLSREIVEEKEKYSNKTGCILFLTFMDHLHRLHLGPGHLLLHSFWFCFPDSACAKHSHW